MQDLSCFFSLFICFTWSTLFKMIPCLSAVNMISVFSALKLFLLNWVLLPRGSESYLLFLYFVVLFLWKIWFFLTGYWDLFCSYFKRSLHQIWLLFFFLINLKKFIYINILIFKLNLCFSIPFFYKYILLIYYFHLWHSSSPLFSVQVQYNLEVKNQIVLCKFFFLSAYVQWLIDQQGIYARSCRFQNLIYSVNKFFVSDALIMPSSQRLTLCF